MYLRFDRLRINFIKNYLYKIQEIDKKWFEQEDNCSQNGFGFIMTIFSKTIQNNHKILRFTLKTNKFN